MAKRQQRIEGEWVKIDDLKPAPYNPRKATDKEVADLRASLALFGVVDPIVVNRHPKRMNTIVGGHLRVFTWKKLGHDRIPCVFVNLEEPRERELNLRLNKNLGQWDWDLLAEFDVPLLLESGFLEAELAFHFDLSDNIADEKGPRPQPPDNPTTQVGDLWCLGDHRLMCGDSSQDDVVDTLVDGCAIHLVNTDPPYNVSVEPRTNNARAEGSRALPDRAKKKMHHQRFDNARHGKPKPSTRKMRPKDRILLGDFMSDADFRKLLMAWFGNMARVMVKGGAFYVWGGFSNWANYCDALKACGLYFSHGITWVKNQPVLGRKDYMIGFENAWYGWKEGAGHKFHGPTNACDVWNVKKVPNQSTVHLTEKPVELAIRAIQNSSRAGEHVLDLFGGSGSTLIGCDLTGRRCFMMELDPAYCDVIVQRWERHTGNKAIRRRAPKSLPSSPSR